MFEIYEDEVALEDHEGSPHFLEVIDVMKETLEGGIESLGVEKCKLLTE